MPTLGSANISWALPAQGSINQQIQYRVAGSGGAFTTYSTVSPSVSSAVVSLAPGSYEFQILNICANGVTTASARTTYFVCSCPTGYTKNAAGNCQRVVTQTPTTLFSNYCLAPSNLDVYSQYFTRVYNTGFSNATIQQFTPSIPSDVYTQYTTVGQWVVDPTENSGHASNFNYTTGPLNRYGVWIDTDCDGIKNSLADGAQTTISYAYNNSGVARRVYVGIAADNLFTLKVNGVEIAKITNATPPENFKIWHIFPVNITTGWNYFNAVATGDGTVNDSIGMAVYDVQTPQSFDGSHSSGSTYDIGLNVLFNTKSLVGQHIDISTCNDGYSLDTSAGQGNYICRKIDITPCS